MFLPPIKYPTEEVFLSNVCRGCLLISPIEISQLNANNLKEFSQICDIQMCPSSSGGLCLRCSSAFRQATAFRLRAQYADSVLREGYLSATKYSQVDLNEIRQKRQNIPAGRCITRSKTLVIDSSNTNTDNVKVYSHSIKKSLDPLPQIKTELINNHHDETRSSNNICDLDSICDRNESDVNFDSGFSVFHNLKIVDSLLNSTNGKPVQVTQDIYTDDNYVFSSINELVKVECGPFDYDDGFDECYVPVKQKKVKKSLMSLKRKHIEKKLLKSKKLLENGKVSKKIQKDVESVNAGINEDNIDGKSNRNDWKCSSFYKYDESEVETFKLSIEEQIKDMEERRKNEKYLSSPFPCQYCAKWFTYELGLSAHLVQHKESSGDFACQICKLRYKSAKSLRSHSITHEEQFQCKQCGKILRSRGTIAQHLALHNGIRPTFSCRVCGKISASLRTHQRHQRSHGPPTVHRCPYCPKEFTILSVRNDHVARLHTKQKKFPCEICGNCFVNRSALRSHVLKHSDYREFYCVECDLGFKARQSLTNHLKESVRHRDPSTLSFVCDRCERRFSSAEKLKLHIAYIHELEPAFACSYCDKRFRSDRGLRSHRALRHEGKVVEKKIPCTVCDRKFNTKEILMNHLLIHTGEKPHVCDTCQRPFRQKCALTTHIRLVHLKIKRIKKQDTPAMGT